MHYDKDYALAHQLQEQYDRHSYSKNKIHTTSVKIKQKSTDLSSPSWELNDPNPNVYALFMQFDRQYFWSSLSSVVVRWSKRMYSCAGICRYEGRGGFCDIALSEPLLKLRPRKDLIQTLLHEMIHAYLFLTKSNRDRDGHGPDFHEHMYRINREANVNITVYHTFIEEVHFYQTHWWRCNGPCQSRKPFFGMVRRTNNRTPGPSDYWWARHQQLCGGQFIKIKEPEKNKIKQTKITSPPKTSKADIREYFKSPRKNLNYPSSSKEGSIKSTNFPRRPSDTTKANPVKSISEISKRISKAKDIKNTINIELPKANKEKIIIHPSTENSSNEVRDTVRNHWSVKYSDNKKRLCDNDVDIVNPKKLSKTTNSLNISTSKNIDLTVQPKSTEKIAAKNKKHIPEDKLNDCKNILYDLYGKSVITDEVIRELCNTNDKTTTQKDNSAFARCPICDASVSNEFINTHLDECMLPKEFTDNDFKNAPLTVIDLTMENEFRSPSLWKDEINLTGITDSEQDIKFHNCPICNKKISDNNTEDHLEECLNTTFKNETNDMPSSSNDTVDFFSDDFDESQEYNSSGTKITCPCCYTLFEESEMNEHLDGCLI